ncbi:hypothetical protein KNP414_03312 [Paenibacillus mucilaginosus KNP414]|uniref:Uncharacterized protein n=1 Tax=Paenibacillus mucilaginosus (strain KNP414) TaxID=1036673 RepID=F8FFF2_PAEMK|nr:hypothetical protein KNP414_03312 [Paenibacillus mucilaginosus KNP414]
MVNNYDFYEEIVLRGVNDPSLSWIPLLNATFSPFVKLT